MQKESLYNQVKSIAGGTAPDAIPVDRAERRRSQSAKAKLTDLQRQKVQLLERYGEQAPAGASRSTRSSPDAQRQLDLEIARAVQSVRNEYEAAVLEERTLVAEPRRREEPTRRI